MLESILMKRKVEEGRVGYGTFIAEVPYSQFTSYSNLATITNVTQGNVQNNTEGWLKFSLDNKELFVAKKNIRINVTWDHLNLAGCVYGEKVVMVQGKLYKVRLLKGADSDPAVVIGPNGSKYLEGTHNSEWSRLFYPIVSNDAFLNSNYTGPKDHRYTEYELDLPNPPYSWCQERVTGEANSRVLRGYGGATFYVYLAHNVVRSDGGWRPCLELME